MSQKNQIELVSFKLCPYVQRSVIILLEKGIEFSIKYIDLANKPDWFLKLSPLGKVPILRVQDEVIFESAVISEYLDETKPPALHPQDPLIRAKNRAWIEFGSGLIINQAQLLWAETKDQFEEKKEILLKGFLRLEDSLNSGPYFNGSSFSLVDSAYAPLWMRSNLLAKKYNLDLLEGMPKLQAWSIVLLALDSVQNSVVDDFEELFVQYLKNKNSYVTL